MAKSFKDLYGISRELPISKLDIEIDVNEDIATGEISSYFVILEGDYKYQIDSDTYKAIERYLNS